MHSSRTLLPGLSDPLALTAGLGHRLAAAGIAALLAWAVVGWAW